MSPEAQHEHPHLTASGAHVTETHVPLLQIWPQPQAGVHTFAGHNPLVHAPPPAQPHVPPHESPPPHVPSVAQRGLQQLPPYRTDPLWQPHVFPQPSVMPPRESFVGQFGAQHAPMYKALPLAHAQVLPHPSDLPALLPSLGQLGLQQLPPYSSDPL